MRETRELRPSSPGAGFSEQHGAREMYFWVWSRFGGSMDKLEGVSVPSQAKAVPLVGGGVARLDL